MLAFIGVLIDRLYIIDAVKTLELCEVSIRLDQHHVMVFACSVVDEAGCFLARADAGLYCGRFVLFVVGQLLGFLFAEHLSELLFERSNELRVGKDGYIG